MLGGHDLCVNHSSNAPFTVDHESDALRVEAQKHDVEGLREPPICIGNQRKWQFVLVREALVAFVVVDTDTDDPRIQRRELLEGVPEVASLLGTDGGEILRIKINDDGAFPNERVEVKMRTVLVGYVKGWGKVTGFKHAKNMHPRR